MNTTSSEKLIYSPIIDYEKDYYSDKENKDDLSYDKVFVKTPESLEELQDLTEHIQLLVVGLPNDLKDLIGGVLDPVLDFVIENKDYLEDVEVEEDDNDDDLFDDETEIDEDDKFIPVVNIIDNDNEKESIKKLYKDNISDLLINYIEKLKKALENYWTSTGLILFGKTKEFKKFILEDLPSDFKTDKDQHLLDFAIRTQIHRHAKMSYASKSFPVEESILNLRSLKLSTDLMIRYLEEEKKDANASEYNNVSNAVLEACIVNYKAKYNNTLKSVHKYLNSSVELTDEIMQLSIQEIKSKQFL